VARKELQVRGGAVKVRERELKIWVKVRRS